MIKRNEIEGGSVVAVKRRWRVDGGKLMGKVDGGELAESLERRTLYLLSLKVV